MQHNRSCSHFFAVGRAVHDRIGLGEDPVEFLEAVSDRIGERRAEALAHEAVIEGDKCRSSASNRAKPSVIAPIAKRRRWLNCLDFGDVGIKMPT